MIAMMNVVSPRVVFGDDLPGSMAAQCWDRSQRRSVAGIDRIGERT